MISNKQWLKAAAQGPRSKFRPHILHLLQCLYCLQCIYRLDLVSEGHWGSRQATEEISSVILHVMR